MKTAIVIGATGLVGSLVTQKLLEDNRYDKVKVFVRRSLNINNPKLEEHIVDFDNIELWKNNLSGDELYSVLGTTIKKAGSKEAQYKIDFTYQYEIAKAASENGNEFTNVGRVDVISSLRNPDWVQKDFSIALDNIKVRYVKIFAKNLAELPPWHPESGGKPWLMIDEIIVE